MPPGSSVACSIWTAVPWASVITGKERQIKVIMAEHKGVVSEILRTLLASQ